MRALEPNERPDLCSLLDLRAGARAVVRGFGGDVPLGVARRLVSMGLPIGTEAEVLVRRSRGPLLLRARDARIALGQDEARGIQVERIEPEAPAGRANGR